MTCIITDDIIAFPLTQTWSCYGAPCYPAYVMFHLGLLSSFISRMLWEMLHLLRILVIVLLLSISVHFLVLVWFLIGIPAIELSGVNSKVLATLLLGSEWSIVSFYFFCSFSHHSNIDHATQPIFRVHLSINVQLCMLSLSTPLYHLIWQMLSPCSHDCGNPSFQNLDKLSLSSSTTSLFLHWFNDEILFWNSLP